MSDVPQINSFKVEDLSSTEVILSCQTENAHVLEVMGFGRVGFDNRIVVPRDPKKHYNFKLIAKNIESNISTIETIDLYPAPIIEKFESKFAKGKVFLNWSVDNTIQCSVEGIEDNIKLNTITIPFNCKQKEMVLKLIADGENVGESISKTLKVDLGKKCLANRLKPILIIGGAFFLGLILLFFLFPKSSKLDYKSQSLECSFQGQDSLMVVQKIITALLSSGEVSDQKILESKIQCILQFGGLTSYLLVITNNGGYDYHTFFDYVRKSENLNLKVDTFEVKRGLKKIKIFASQMKDDANEFGGMNEKDIRLPILFQGKIHGRLKRLQVLSQRIEQDSLYFKYSIIGVGSQQDKIGILNIKNDSLFLENLGKGRVTQHVDEFLFELNNNTIIFKSL